MLFFNVDAVFCSVKVKFIVMFLHKSGTSYCHRVLVFECTDFDIVADHMDFLPWFWIAPVKTLLP